MLLSTALILLVGMITGWICTKIKLPGLVGMILTGILLGPHVLDIIDSSILGISADLRKIALIIILTRAGLTLNIADLKKVGRPAVMMCFVPASLEMAGMVLIAPKLLDLSLMEAAILGAVIAAVSPAVVVPKMIKLMDEGYGTQQSIPQMILAGASVDDVFVIVMFTTFTSLEQGGHVDVMKFVNIPVSIVLGILIGMLAGWILALYFERVHIRDTVKVVIFLCVSFLLVSGEDHLNTPITYASLISIMFIGVALQKKREVVAKRLSIKFNKLWVGAEVLLFVLVGATVDIEYMKNAGLAAVAVIIIALLFRMFGVWLCVVGTKLNWKERIFCMFAYTPKATVQAAIGGVPLALGLSCGNIVLTVAVLAIVITAPFGAFMIDLLSTRFLSKKTS